MTKIHLAPSGKMIEIKGPTNIRQALSKNGINLISQCGGMGGCGCCKVKILSGEENLSPINSAEEKFLGNVFHITRERLACQSVIYGDITVDISEHENTRVIPKKFKIRKKVERPTPLTENNEEKTRWYRHWEKSPTEKGMKKLGGGQRPKYFDTDKLPPPNTELNTRPVKKHLHPRKKRSRS
jgi:ferredoxin, 2Fe-2S